MGMGLWLPSGYELSDGSKIQSLLSAGEDWQIFNTNSSNSILLIRIELARNWIEYGFLEEEIFADISFGTESFKSLSSHNKYILSPVEGVASPNSKVDALAFALALKESRKISKDVSFHNAIYVEQYTRLLPVSILPANFNDEVVLGTWLSGGVVLSTESFRRLSKLTGYMPAGDLAEIVSAAGFALPSDVSLLSKRKAAPQSNTEVKIAVSTDTVASAKKQIPQETKENTLFKLPGRPHLEAFFNEHIIDIIFNTDKYQAMGIDFPSAIVLHGPPGCGKTFAVERLIEFIDWPSYSIDSNSVGSPYIHETSKKISEVFDTAISNAPSIIVIDEMESFLTDRRSGSSSGLHHIEEVAEFLRRIPEAIKNKVLIVAMTNLIDTIDPAILRRGRFDHIVEVSMPSREEVASLVDSLFKKLPKSEDINLASILDELTGKALSDSAFVIREAARHAAKANKAQIDQECVDFALNSLPTNSDKPKRSIGFVSDNN